MRRTPSTRTNLPSLLQSPTLECIVTHGPLIRHHFSPPHTGTPTLRHDFSPLQHCLHCSKCKHQHWNISMPEHDPRRHWRGGIATIVASSHKSFSSRPLLNTSTASHHVYNHCQFQLILSTSSSSRNKQDTTGRHQERPPVT